MKNKKIILGLCLLLLCSCDSGLVSSTTDTGGTTTPTSDVTSESTIPAPLTDWREDSITNMQKAIGEKLPFAFFSPYYVDESFEDEDGTFVFYVRDPKTWGQSVGYQGELNTVGFELLFNETSKEGQISTLGKAKDDGTEIRIEVQNYFSLDGKTQELRLMAYLIKKTTAWPLKEIVSVVGYEVEIPSFEADEYFIYPNPSKNEIELYIPQLTNECVTIYRNILLDKKWNMVEGTESTPYFASNENYEIEFLYEDSYFRILIRYNGTNPPLIEGDIVINHQWFENNGNGYQDKEFGYGGIIFMVSGMSNTTFKGEKIVQMKKQVSSFKNKFAVTQGIESIRIDEVKVKENPIYQGTITVYAVDENEVKTKIDAEDGLYNLKGAPYFIITNESGYVFYFRSLSIQLCK